MPERRAGQPSLLRAINLRAVFDLVQARGPIGAPGVVRGTGLSRPTVGDILEQLVGLDLIRPVGRTTGFPGPGARLYDVNPAAGWVLGLDVGREWVRAAITDMTGATVARTASRMVSTSAAGLIEQLRSAGERLAGEVGLGLGDVSQIVVGTPGVIFPGQDHLSLAPSLPGWEGPGVVGEIERALLAPVVFENDVNLAAVGEHLHGVAQGVDDFVLLSVGSGVGMGVILDGELRRGATGLAGEIGYLALELDHAAGKPSAAWGMGAFEALTSSAGIVELARARGWSEARTAAEVFTAARSGNAAMNDVVAIEARRLAHAIAAVSAVLDPGLVVLGGGVGTGSGDLLLAPIVDALGAISPFSPRLSISALGVDGVLVGASVFGLRLALDRLFERAADDGGRPRNGVGPRSEARPVILPSSARSGDGR